MIFVSKGWLEQIVYHGCVKFVSCKSVLIVAVFLLFLCAHLQTHTYCPRIARRYPFPFSVVPEFTELPANRVAIQGNNVTLPCRAVGIPNPSVTWNFSGGSLPEHSNDNGALRLFDAMNTNRFEGRYTCIASSRAGSISSAADLTVDGEHFNVAFLDFGRSLDRYLFFILLDCLPV